MDRKEFIRKGIQLSIFTGMLAGTGLLISQKKLGFTCSKSEQCKACSKYNNCSLDKAIASRKDER